MTANLQDQQDVMAIQTILRSHAGFNDNVNGVRTPAMRAAMSRFLSLAQRPGHNLEQPIMDLQRILERRAGYTAGIDGDAGPGTRNAAQRFMNLRGPGLNVQHGDVAPVVTGANQFAGAVGEVRYASATEPVSQVASTTGRFTPNS